MLARPPYPSFQRSTSSGASPSVIPLHMIVELSSRMIHRASSPRPGAGLGLALALLLVARVGAAQAAEAPQPVDSVRQLVSDWAKIREETVRLESAWDSERDILNSSSKAANERAQALATQKKTLEAKTAGEREALAAMVAQNAAAEAALKSATDRMTAISAQLVALRPWLPPRLSQGLELSYRSLAKPTLTPGERMQYVTTILNRCAQFNKAITCGEEPLSLAGESTPRVLEVIYWGASHGYALDRTAAKAYIGSPGAQGWAWEPAPNAEKSIAQLIAIYREKADPDFIQVPAHVSNALPN